MDFDLNDEQRMLKDSVDRLLADRYDFESRVKYAASEAGYSTEIWNQLAELGLMALPFSEEDGGFGGGGEEAMIVMESFGRSLVVEPYFATVVLGGGLLTLAGNAEQRQRLAPGLIDGSAKAAFAHSEPQARYALNDVRVTAKKDSDGYVLEGGKTLVLHGAEADLLFVSARISGGNTDEAGVGLFVVDANAEGVSRRGYKTQDGMQAAEITLSGVKVAAENVLSEDAMPVIRETIDRAIAALCAEAVGAMEAAHELTIEYLKTRQQFGRHIGAFQALQHAGAEMFVALEQARSMAMYAAVMSRDEDPEERARAVSAAKVQIDRSAREIGQASIQLHGGVGMTMEFAIGHYFKRLTMISKLFGDTDMHVDRIASGGGMTY